MRLKDKVAIVTGATSGIGRAGAILFAREGAKVVVVGRRKAAGEETVKRIKGIGGKAIFVKADVSKASEIKRMVDETVQTYGKIDILFNNAGILPEASKKQLKDLSEEVWDRVMAVNVKGVFLTSKHVIPEMIKTGGGSIINTSSNVGHIAMKHRSVYVTSKGGVTLLTKAMALDYAPYNIRANCICPAVVETEMASAFLKTARKDKKLWGEMMSKIPLGRVGTPEDVAYAALFLASDESSWITGSSLMVDGGYTAQ
jgi:NAD(P)-dependent dehydrogenase (short-subunit alcohol dehydrogenase family)